MSSTPTTWKEYTLGDLGYYINGRAFKPSEWDTSGLPIIRIQNLTDPDKSFNYFNGEVDEKHFVQDGDLLISWSATLGSFIWDRGNAALNQHIFKVEVNEEIVQKEFLHYLILYSLDELSSQTHGSTMKHITKRKFEATTVQIPPLEEQRRLVARIRECLDRVDAVHELREEAQEAANSVFSAVLKDLNDSLDADDAKLGNVLKGMQNGRSLRATPADSNGHVLSLAAVRSIYLDRGEDKPVKLDDELVDKFGISSGDVFVSRSNTRELVGLSAIAGDEDWGRVIFPDLMIRLTPDPDQLRPKYLAIALRFPSVRAQIQSHAKGTSSSMVKISQRSLRKVSIPVPTRSEQDQLVKKALQAQDTASALCREQSEQADHEEKLTQSILARAFAGDI